MTTRVLSNPKIANCEKELKFEYKQIIDQLLIRWKKHLIWKWISIPYKIANLNICTSFQHQYHPIIELLWYYRLVLPNCLFFTTPNLLIFCVKFSVCLSCWQSLKKTLLKKICMFCFFTDKFFRRNIIVFLICGFYKITNILYK